MKRIIIALSMIALLVGCTATPITAIQPMTVTPTVIPGEPAMSTTIEGTFTIIVPVIEGFEVFLDAECTIPLLETIVIPELIALDSFWTQVIYAKNTGDSSLLLTTTSYPSTDEDIEILGYFASIAPSEAAVLQGEVVEFTLFVYVLDDATPGEGSFTATITAS